MELKNLKLPLSLIGSSEVAKLLRELEKLDDFFVGASAQTDNAAAAPRLTHMLDQLARDNKINLLEAAGRKNLSGLLNQLRDNVPSLNVSFAAEPSPKAFEQILLWFRQNIHPQTLLSIGLQPSIAAGCVLRTPNKIFDMSVGARLETQESYLAKLIDGVVK